MESDLSETETVLSSGSTAWSGASGRTRRGKRWSRASSVSSLGSRRSSGSGGIVWREAGDGDEAFELQAAAVLVTWSRSRIEDAELFYGKLVELMPSGTSIFGVQERHENGEPHYHAVLKFPMRVHWRGARERFMMRLDDGSVDTGAIRFSVPYQYQRMHSFLQGTQRYLMKDPDRKEFGEYIQVMSAAESLKRKYEQAVKVEDYFESKRLLMEADAVAFVRHYSNIVAFLDGEKRRRWGAEAARRKDVELKPWVVPDALEEWRRANVVMECDRPVPLILVGDPRWGKTMWAERAGERPMVMTKQWNLDNYRHDATHVVLNDVDFGRFGSGGVLFWREVLGCQPRFDASDKYKRKVCLPWGFPVVVTCNHDNDPRLLPEIAAYLERAPCVVVELQRSLFD